MTRRYGAGTAMGTPAWRRLRAAWQVRLLVGGPVACGWCGEPVSAGDAWDLGHLVDRARGGTDADGVVPQHRSCNRAAGGRLGHELKREREGNAVPSRRW